MATQLSKEIENAGDKEPSEIRTLVIKRIEKLFPTVRSVGTDTLQQWMDEKPKELLILDFRSAAEFEISHLPGAILASAEGLALQEVLKEQFMQASSNSMTWEMGAMDEYTKLPFTESDFCIGYRSSVAAQLANEILPQVVPQQSATSLDVYNIQGGLMKWAAERRRMVNLQETPTQVVHVFSPIWSKLLEVEFRAKI